MRKRPEWGRFALATDVARANGNGNGNGATAPEPAPRLILQQLSSSGTERGRDGIILPDEYVRELHNPIRRMEIFEEMGNDDAIAKALQARVQEINAANWTLTTKDESDDGQRRLRFAEDNLYPFLEQLLRHLGGGPLQYGFSAVEPVFAWSDVPFFDAIARGKVVRPAERTGERQLRLWKIAHVMPKAVAAFITDPQGNLTAIRQDVWSTGNGQRTIDLPPAKLILLVYDKQGDDFYGQPPMRRCYKPWKYKAQYEKLTLMHHDRFGVGIPIVYEPEGGFTPAERTLVMQWMINVRAGATNAGTLPRNAKFEIVTGTGELSAAALNFIKLYNLQIAGIYGTQQTELGSTETGSRAVGETHDEQRQSVSQSDAEQIAAVINNELVVRLIDYNFGKPANGIYPIFTPSLRQRTNSTLPEKLVAAKTAGVFHPRPEDEVKFRDDNELAEVSLEDLRKEQEARDIQAAAIAEAQKQQPASTPPAGDGKPSGAPPSGGRSPLRIAATERAVLLRELAVTLAEGAPEPAVPGKTTHRTREYSEWEGRVLDIWTVIDRLNLETQRGTGEIVDALAAIDDYLHAQALAAAEGGAAALQAIQKSIAVPDRLRNRLRTAARAIADRARDYGEGAVYREVQRQIGPEGVGPQRSPDFPMFSARRDSRLRAAVNRLISFATAGSDTEKTPRQLRIEAAIDEAVEAEIGRREQSTLNAIRTALTQAAGLAVARLASVLSTALKDGLSKLSSGVTQQNVEAVVNVGFGAGRSDAADAINAAAARETGEAKRATAGAIATPDGDLETIDDTGDTTSRPAPKRSGAGGGSRSGLRDAETGEPIELVGWYYSAVMDFGSCDECAKWDGAFFPIDYPDDITGVQCPNPKCHGTEKRCRCVKIFVTAAEAPANVGPSKGPVPVERAANDAAIAAMRAEFEAKITALGAQLAAKPDATPQPISIALTIEAPKAGTRRVEMLKADGSKITADVTET